MSAVLDTIDDIRHMASLHEAVLVACSFGKDSLVVLDLCHKHFQRVEVLHLTFVLGMSLTAKQCEYVKQRWGLDVLVMEHPGATWNKVEGYRCFASDVKRVSFADAFAEAKQKTNCPIVATGIRASEGYARSGGIKRGQQGLKVADYFGDWQPIAHWKHNKQYSDVATYCRNNNIEPFEPMAGSRHGLDNSADTILTLHDRFPDDYAKWLEVFPLASCVVKRRELYGIS